MHTGFTRIFTDQTWEKVKSKIHHRGTEGTEKNRANGKSKSNRGLRGGRGLDSGKVKGKKVEQPRIGTRKFPGQDAVADGGSTQTPSF